MGTGQICTKSKKGMCAFDKQEGKLLVRNYERLLTTYVTTVKAFLGI